MKKSLLIAMLLAASGAQAEDIVISCKIYIGEKKEPVISTYKIIENGKKVQFGGHGDIVPMESTEAKYRWEWWGKMDGEAKSFVDVVNRYTGEITTWNGITPIAKGMCEKSQRKF